MISADLYSDIDRSIDDPTLAQIAEHCAEIQKQRKLAEQNKQLVREKSYNAAYAEALRIKVINTQDIPDLSYEDILYIDRGEDFPLAEDLFVKFKYENLLEHSGSI